MTKSYGSSAAALGLLLASPGFATAVGAGTLSYTDVTDAAGVRFTQTSDTAVPIGGGTVWSDFDNDGDDDLYMADGFGCNRLFRNNGDGAFTEVADAAGASDCRGVGHGATSADHDNDGDQDLFVTNNGQNRLFRNRLIEDGSPSFEDVTVAAGLDNDGHNNHSTAIFGDYDQDGNLDLFVGTHFTTMVPLDCRADLLYHSNGDGTFTEVGGELGITSPADGCALGGTWSDYDNDGDLDLIVINDFGAALVPNRLFRNDGPGGPGGWTFTDVSAESGFDYVMFGMGVGKGDVDLDGDLDYYMADIGANDFGRNNGDGTFKEIALSSGCKGTDEEEIWGGNGLVSWSPVLVDADHDGFEDIFFANGGAPERKFPGLFGADYIDQNPPYAYRNLKTKCSAEAHALIGLTPPDAYYRTMTISDYDDDGDMDIMMNGIEGDNALLRNDLGGSDVHWLKVKVRGTVGNRDGLGARVQIFKGTRSQVREVDGEQSFLSINTKVAHFGLKGVTQLDRVVVTFLGGRTVELQDVAADQTIEVVEPGN